MLSTAFSDGAISRATNLAANVPMDVREIRRANLAALVRMHGGQTHLAELVDTDAAYLSQILSPVIKANVGHALARRIELALGKPRGWMDAAHATSISEPNGQYNVAEPVALELDRVPIVGDTGTTARINPDLTDEYLDAPAPHPGVYALKVRGASQAPRIREGDVVSISPVAEIVPGEEAVLGLKSGEQLIRQIVSLRAGEIVVCNVNGDDRRVIARAEIEYLHAIIGIHPGSQIKRR